jgi:hypothetical protein
VEVDAMTNAMRSVVFGLSALCFSGCAVAYRTGPDGSELVVAQPGLTLIADTGISWAADAGGDVFFYGGRWYWCDGPYWYGAGAWGDPWVYIASPPIIFLNIPVGHPRYYVVDRHPESPRYAAYRQTVSAQYKAPPERREFAQVRGMAAPKADPPGRSSSKDPPPEPGPWTKAPAPGPRADPPGRVSREEPPNKGPKADDDESGGRGHKH